MTARPEPRSKTPRTQLASKLTQRRCELAMVAALFAFAGCGSIDVALQQDVASEARSLSPAVDDDQAVRDLGKGGSDPSPDPIPQPHLNSLIITTPVSEETGKDTRA